MAADGGAETGNGAGGEKAAAGPVVGLFATCLVDLMRPRVGFAALRLLEAAGCRVRVPLAQTCCGQPAWNMGARAPAGALARKMVDAFDGVDHVVAPSGSCAAMIRRHYPALLRGDAAYAVRAEALAARTYELTAFLVEICGVESVEARYPRKLAYHDACSGLRELGVRDQPRRLLATVEGLEFVELADAEECCGFGGSFSVAYGDISAAILDRKVESLARSGAEALAAGDLGCLFNIWGRVSRRGLGIEVRHVAEILAGMTGGPPIGQAGAGESEDRSGTGTDVSETGGAR